MCNTLLSHSMICHLSHFNVPPGTSANSLNFLIYLLEGLHRWNQDRRVAALANGTTALRSYSGDLMHCVNSNFERLFGRKVAPVNPPVTQVRILHEEIVQISVFLEWSERNGVCWLSYHSCDCFTLEYDAKNLTEILSNLGKLLLGVLRC